MYDPSKKKFSRSFSGACSNSAVIDQLSEMEIIEKSIVTATSGPL